MRRGGEVNAERYSHIKLHKEPMTLSAETKVLKLIEDYPFLNEFLMKLNPHFEALRNPLMRNTVGRIATLQMASAMGGVPLDKLIAELNAEILRQTGSCLNVSAVLSSNASLDPEKLDALKGIIKDLHDGGNFEALKERFTHLVKDIDPQGIAQMEQALIAEGMPETEIKRLCDVHVAMFKDSLNLMPKPEALPGHPVHTFIQENKAFSKLIEELRKLLQDLDPAGESSQISLIKEKLMQLSQVELHYQRKEYQLFPFLEKHGFTGPSRVMWAIHDDIRAALRKFRGAADAGDIATVMESEGVLQAIEDMIYKEENILFAVSLDMLSNEEWQEIRAGEAAIGYALIEPGKLWHPGYRADEAAIGASLERIPLDIGLLSLEQLNLMLLHLPVELSFVDENDEVRYYTGLEEKIFPRSPGVIGRKVQNCHPPKSLHMVQSILDSFRAGTKDVAEFWIEMNGRFIHIRYFAVRDVEKRYRGTLEVVQDVTGIRKLEGQKRLMA